MRENVLFEINVYRCTKAKHKEQTLRVKNRYDKAGVNVEGILYETGEIYTYHYNELIGVLVLQPFCSQIRGYLYLEKAKRRRGPSEIIWQGRANYRNERSLLL